MVGHYFQQHRNSTMLACGIIGAVLTASWRVWEQADPVSYPAGFYRTPPAATLWHLGIVLMALSAWTG